MIVCIFRHIAPSRCDSVTSSPVAATTTSSNKASLSSSLARPHVSPMLHATTTTRLAPVTTTTNNNNMNVNSGKCDVTLTEVSDPSTPTNVKSIESRDDMQLLAVLEEANRCA